MRSLKNTQFCSSSRKAIRHRWINYVITLSILRIALKIHFVQNVEPDIPLLAGGKRGRFARVSKHELAADTCRLT